MRDLRARFGFVLALAMLPLLVFSVWQSHIDYQRDSESRYTALVLQARQSATQILSDIEQAKSVIVTLDEALAESDCNQDVLDNVLSRFGGIKTLHVLDDTYKPVCSTDSSVPSISLLNPALDMSVQSPFVLIPRQTIGLEENAVFIRMAYGSYQDGSLNRIVVADLRPGHMTPSAIPFKLEDSVKVSIFDSQGVILAGKEIGSSQDRQNWIDQSEYLGEFRASNISSSDASGQQRDLIVLATTDNDLFIGLSQNTQSLLSWNYLNPLSSAIVPFLAWVFGFLAIWVATDQLILTHLRKMRASLLMFGRGDIDRRIGSLNNPPQSILELARSFDLMADRISSREQELADMVGQKDVLLREIHHRVKNNLQIIISLLNMQERKLDDDEAALAIRETRHRINAIALVHRGLYESADLRYIPMDVFIERLVREVSVAYAAGEQNITLSSTVNCIPLEADTAIPVALFIVEAVTNAIKHGLSIGGEICVGIQQTGQTIRVSVSDDGPGFDPGGAEPGTGTRLIQGFARQLSGSIAHETFPDGHAITLTFEHRPYANNI